MNALILAAGFGSRLMPLTKDTPKCMVEYKNRKIIDYELEALQRAICKDSKEKIDNIAVVGGYKANKLKDYLQNKIYRFYVNEDFANTNMVYTLFCARDFLNECIHNKKDLIISYADIIYSKDIVERLMESKNDIDIVVDDMWLNLWQKRFANPLLDAETLKIHNGKIKEIGKKPSSLQDIQSQYIGLFKIDSNFLGELIRFYDNLNKKAMYDNKSFKQMYMTSFLQALIDKYDNAYAVRIDGGWCEIDNVSDLEI